ncbi:MAG: hypothetical protein IJE53_01300 [Bacilli bacterium]|nr:hypothetical protein [Bacilli bacterium]
MMKIIINYDLMDKIAEAKQGYSLKRCVKRTLGMASVTALIGVPDNLINGNISPDLWIELSAYLMCHTSFTATLAWAFQNMTKESAQRMLSSLILELRSKCIKTDEEAILDTRKYKTEYDVSFASAIPTIEQRKYLNIPVRDEYFGDKEISMIQEHIVGSKEYVLSLGEPKEQKVYSLKMKTMKGE